MISSFSNVLSFFRRVRVSDLYDFPSLWRTSSISCKAGWLVANFPSFASESLYFSFPCERQYHWVQNPRWVDFSFHMSGPIRSLTVCLAPEEKPSITQRAVPLWERLFSLSRFSRFSLCFWFSAVWIIMYLNEDLKKYLSLVYSELLRSVVSYLSLI